MRAAPLLLLLALPAPAAAQDAWGMADGVWGAETMARAREALVREHGGMRHWFLLADRLEHRLHDGDSAFLADLEGWWGTDEHRLWLKSETEYDVAADEFEKAKVEALYARPVAPFWDVQAGVRVDAAGEGERVWGVVGVEGLAPYFFHVDAALYVSGRGEFAADVEASTDVLLTQRLVLQPRAEVSFAAEDMIDRRTGAGLSTAELGLRLRYEFRREFAPYVGVEWERAVGRTADFARADGEPPGAIHFVAGVRLWF